MKKLSATALVLLGVVLGDVLQLSSRMSAGCADEKQEALPAVAQFNCPPGTIAKLNPLPVKDMRWCENEYGQRHGPMVMWHETTKKLWVSIEYVNGKKHGPATHFHRNGVKYSEGVYVNDFEDGKWKRWNECGTLISVEIRDASREGALVQRWQPPEDDWSSGIDDPDADNAAEQDASPADAE